MGCDASSSQGFVRGWNVMHLDAYRDQVQCIAADRSGGAIVNGSLNSAAIVVEALFSIARENVTILTGKLSPECTVETMAFCKRSCSWYLMPRIACESY